MLTTCGGADGPYTVDVVSSQSTFGTAGAGAGAGAGVAAGVAAVAALLADAGCWRATMCHSCSVASVMMPMPLGRLEDLAAWHQQATSNWKREVSLRAGVSKGFP